MQDAAAVDEEYVVIGRIGAPYGVKGWVHVQSFSDPVSGLLDYSTWYLRSGNGWRAVKIDAARPHGKMLVACLEGCSDRNAAELFVNAEVAVLRNELPSLDKGEYYWLELIGLEVFTLSGQSLGQIDHLFETGANDVIVVKGDRERMVPYVPGEVIHSVDLDKRQMIVDWDPEF